MEPHNQVLQDTLWQRFNSEKQEFVDVRLTDYDGAAYHIHTPDEPSILFISFRWHCFPALVKYGAVQLLEKQFGSFIAATPEAGWDFTLVVNLAQTVDDKEEFISKVGRLKHTVMSAPLERAFAEHDKLGKDKSYRVDQELMRVAYRVSESGEEVFWIRAQQDRVTVIFKTMFQEDSDRIFGRVFLQEFVDARRQAVLQNAPQVLSSKEAPLDLRQAGGVEAGEKGQQTFVTFVLFPRHFSPGPVREQTTGQILLFRNYLHYHIKCCKAYMHSRMRKRVQDFLKVLNRAKPDSNTSAESKDVPVSGKGLRRVLTVG